MSLEPSSSRIAVVGTGVIGASWAAYFLARGFDVAATDPANGAEKRLRALIDGFWPALESMGSSRAPREAGCTLTPKSCAPSRAAHSSSEAEASPIDRMRMMRRVWLGRR